MKIRCPECSAVHSNELYMNFKIEDSFITKFFGINTARKAFQKEEFICLENNLILCKTCNCVFDRKYNIHSHSPALSSIG